MYHGLPLDLSMAGYLTAVPALLLLLGGLPLRSLHQPVAEEMQHRAYMIWAAIASVAVALSFVANCVLYAYWRFPLDATPVFFLTSSPRDAMASVEWWQGLLVLLAVMLCATAIILWFRWLCRVCSMKAFGKLRGLQCLLMLLLTAALFLPIRGGVTVSSMNTGKAYFSQNQLLNHAAVNPLFSFMESASHQTDFADQYRFMDNREAARLASTMMSPMAAGDSVAAYPHVLSMDRPDIYLFVLESFSDTLMHQPGVTPNLNRMKQEGVYFSRFYANSFRTDRGLLSVLHGYPSPATVSLMKFPHKTAHIPSLPAALKAAGWSLKYYYGGDADFTNMRSFLVNQGFQNIVEDQDFPVTERLSKWGVPDHLLFQRLKEDLQTDRSRGPVLRVIQTSSSHEPFDVPYQRCRDKILNAFAYTDHWLGDFVNFLKRTSRWKRSLVVLVPDHLGAWPRNADNFATWRFHIPMIWLGGCIRQPMTVGTYASQQDIAATLLGQLGIRHGQLKFSKDIFDTTQRHYAFFMMNDGFGLMDDDNALIFDNKLQQVVVDRGRRKGKNKRLGQAYVQNLFNDIAAR
jgi:phosphoglycerol transferase MdoB-like AlkP superfamily enzyme